MNFKRNLKCHPAYNRKCFERAMYSFNPPCVFRYSVFGLGSSAYPHFCAFGHYMDNIFQDLGAERISKMVEGDELCGQEESFRNWAQEIFRVRKASLWAIYVKT